jgi:hypothetical protein
MPLFVLNNSWGTYALKKASKAFRSSGKSSSGRSSGGRIGGGYTFKFKELKLYDEELRKYLNTPSGDPWVHLERRGRIAVEGAKAMVGVRTGRLKRSIHMKHLGNFKGQYIWIGSKVNYAYAHHEGTKAHTITAKPGGELVFRGKSRVLVHTPAVKHPGTRPNPYLSTQLRHFLI